jgi:23S rRNA pseudouridine955/2504/2580 synthase
MREFTITKNDSGQRLNKFIEKAVPGLPSGLMHKYIRLKRIKRNGKRTEFACRLEEGDVLQLYINDEFFEKPDEDSAFRRIQPNLSILYEDEHIMLLDKKPGVVVHTDDTGEVHTLINHVKAYLFTSGQWNPDAENSFTPSLCNRIDRNTGGIVIAAKDAESLRIMNEKIKNHEITKRYLCLVHGKLNPPAGTIRASIFKDSKQNRVTVSAKPVKGSKSAVTHYRTLTQNGSVSLVECTLETGRTHQIRAHMAYIGHPLVGDGKYGSNAQNHGQRYQALYSYQVTFDFPTPAGCLAYLKGKTFQVADVPFVTELGWQKAIPYKS